MTRRLSCLLVAFLVCATARAQNRAHFAEVELVGPVSDVVLDAGRAGSTRIEGSLLAGESRRLVVPVPLDSDVARTAPIVRFGADPTGAGTRGRVRFLGFKDAASPLSALPAGLRARAMPALEEAHVRVSRAAPLVLVSALVIALALRRRPHLALLGALAAGGALFPLVAVPSRAAEASVTLLDGDVESTSWRRIDAAFDEVGVSAMPGAYELASDPPSAPITWHVPLDPSHPPRATAHGARLFVASVVDASANGLARERNDFGPLEQTWTRDGGAWHEHGPWPEGAALGPVTGSGSPPGWLASHLPQGVPILIARAQPAAGPTPASPAPAWLRISGP